MYRAVYIEIFYVCSFFLCEILAYWEDETYIQGERIVWMRVDISFIEKGNKKYIKMLNEMKCLKKLTRTNGKNGRIINAEIIFNPDGSLN